MLRYRKTNTALEKVYRLQMGVLPRRSLSLLDDFNILLFIIVASIISLLFTMSLFLVVPKFVGSSKKNEQCQTKPTSTDVANAHGEKNQTLLEWHAMSAKPDIAAIAIVR